MLEIIEKDKPETDSLVILFNQAIVNYRVLFSLNQKNNLVNTCKQVKVSRIPNDNFIYL